MNIDTVIVGAGFSGSVFAERLAHERGENVLLIEKKNHIGGHCYDCLDEHGVLIHQYGPHIFHTLSEKVWEYVNRFTRFTSYQHRVLGFIDGQFVPIPFNLHSLEMLFPSGSAQRLEEMLVSQYGLERKVPILELRQNENPELRKLADYIYEKVFLNYTRKQWGLKPEELTTEVTARVPVFISRDDRYFQDPYQGMPEEGYTRLFERMLDHDRIKILLNTDYKEVIGDLKYKRLIFTGPIDYFFDYRYGKLKYRTLDSVTEYIEQGFYQEAATVNYPNDYDFTRITDFKRLTGQSHPGTTIMKEYPRDAIATEDTLYYPMFTTEWLELYRKYEAEARKLENVLFIGRLAQYRYFNMDQAILSALEAFEKLT